MKTKIHLSIISITICICILFSSCASILNGKYQKVGVITGNPETSVYLNDNFVGKGDTVQTKMKRDAKAQQITVKADGYKPEFYSHHQSKKSPWYILSVVPFGLFFWPIIFDVGKKAYNYDRYTKAPLLTTITNHKPEERHLIIKNISVDLKKENFLLEIATAEYMENKSYKPKVESATSEDSIQIYNTMFSEVITDLLKGNGFVDTTGSILKNKMNTLYVNATIKKVKFTIIHKRVGYSQYASNLSCEMSIDWEFQDFYGKPKFKISNVGKSGNFAHFYYYTIENRTTENEQLVTKAADDAITKSFHEALSEEKLATLIQIEKDPIDPMLNTEPIIVENNDTISTIKNASKSTLTISSGKGFGSGCAISKNGYVITTYSVVSGDSVAYIKFSDKDSTIARIVRYNEISDLALLKADTTFEYTLRIPRTENFEITDEVYAIGTPLSTDYKQTITKGIISAYREQEAGTKLIQSDCRINAGCSGGALVSTSGELVGIINSKITGEYVERISFSIPAKDIFSQLNLR